MSNDTQKGVLPQGRVMSAGNENLRAELILDPQLEDRRDELVSVEATGAAKKQLEAYKTTLQALSQIPEIFEDIPVGGPMDFPADTAPAAAAVTTAGMAVMTDAPQVVTGHSEPAPPAPVEAVSPARETPVAIEPAGVIMAEPEIIFPAAAPLDLDLGLEPEAQIEPIIAPVVAADPEPVEAAAEAEVQPEAAAIVEPDPFAGMVFNRVDTDTATADLTTADIAVRAPHSDDGDDEPDARSHADMLWEEEIIDPADATEDVSEVVAEAAVEASELPSADDIPGISDMMAGFPAEAEPEAEVVQDLPVADSGAALDWDLPEPAAPAQATSSLDGDDIFPEFGAHEGREPVPSAQVQDDDLFENSPDIVEAAAQPAAQEAEDDFPSFATEAAPLEAVVVTPSAEVETGLAGADEDGWLDELMTDDEPAADLPMPTLAEEVVADVPAAADEPIEIDWGDVEDTEAEPAPAASQVEEVTPEADAGWTGVSDEDFLDGDDKDSDPNAAQAASDGSEEVSVAAPAPKKTGFLARIIPGGKKASKEKTKVEPVVAEELHEDTAGLIDDALSDAEPELQAVPVKGKGKGKTARPAKDKAANGGKKSQMPLIAASVAVLALAGAGGYVYTNPSLMAQLTGSTASPSAPARVAAKPAESTAETRATPAPDRQAEATPAPVTAPSATDLAAGPARPSVPALSGDLADLSAADDGFGANLGDNASASIEDMFLRDAPLDPAAQAAVPAAVPADASEVAVLGDRIGKLTEQVETLSARLDAVDAAFETRDQGTVQRDAMLAEALDTANRAASLAEAQNQVIVEVIRLQDRSDVNEQLIVDLSQRIQTLEDKDPADRVTFERNVSDLNNRVEGLARDMSLVARVSINGRVNSGAGVMPNAQPRPAAPAGSSMVYAEGASTMTHPNAAPSNVTKDVKVGDLVEGYGKVLDVMGTSDGGKLVIMEHGSVIIPD